MKFLALLLLVFNSSFSLANARDHISYIDFVQMDKSQQHEVIKMLQRFSSHTEYIQNFVIKKNSKNKKRTSYVDFFLNQFKAYAGAKRHDPGEKKSCFFGGWLSHMYDNNNNPDGVMRNLCAHPARLSYDADSGEKRESIFENHGVSANRNSYNEQTKDMAIASGQYYDDLQKEIVQQGKSVNKVTIKENEDGTFELGVNSYTNEENVSARAELAQDKCSTPRDIICNPMVYGKFENGPFCVPKKNDNAYNTSFLCEKAVQWVRDTHPDKYDGVMDQAVQAATANPALFNHTVISMYDNCMCNGKGYSNYTDPTYSDMVYRTRTCVAIINSTKNILGKFSNRSCSMFQTDKLGEVSNMSLFFKRAYKHLNDSVVEMDAGEMSISDMNTYYQRDQISQRRQEVSRINDISGNRFALLSQNRETTDPENLACPISMEENKEGQISVNGVPNLASMTEKISVSYKIDSQDVVLTSGDVTVELVGDNEIPNLNLTALNAINGKVELEVPLVILSQYTLRFTVNKSETTDSANHGVGGPNFSCEFTSSIADGLTSITPTNSLSLSGGGDPINGIDNVSYEIEYGGNTVALGESGIDLGDTDPASIKVWATIAGVADKQLCNGEVVQADRQSLQAEMERDAVEFLANIDVTLVNGEDPIALVKENPTEGQTVLSHSIDQEGITIDLRPGANGAMDVAAPIFHDKEYTITFTTNHDGVEKSVQKTIAPQEVKCTLSGLSVSEPQADGQDSVISIFLSINSGERNISLGKGDSATITYGDIALEESAGDPRDDGKIEFTASAESLPEGQSIAGSVIVTKLGASAINCEAPSTPEIDERRIDTTETVAQCRISTEISSEDNSKAVLKATVSYKGADDEEAQNLDTDAKLSDAGISITWSKQTSAPQDSNPDEMVGGSADQEQREPASAGKGVELTVNKGASDVVYVASVSGSGDNGCSSQNNITVKAQEATSTSTEEESPALDNNVNWSGPQAPGRAPRRRRRGLMFRGTR